MKNIDLGQVFTPRVIADYMVKLFTIKNNSCVLDPCFGEGIFISSLLDNTKYSIDAIEIDKSLFNEAIMKEEFNHCKLYNSNFLDYNFQKQYDGIIMNPPYIRHEKIDNLSEYGITKEKLLSREEFSNLSKTSNIYMYFIIRALDILKQGGELIVIFPSSWIQSKNADNFKKQLEDKATIEKNIFVKGNVFGEETLVDVIILKVIKGKVKRGYQEIAINYDGQNISEIKKNDIKLVDRNHVKLQTYGRIRRGITTGNNKLFVNKFSTIYGGGEFIEGIISSPKSITGYSTEGINIDELLVIDEEFDKLNNELKKYLINARNEILQNQKPKTMVNQIEKGLDWYKLKTYNSKGIIFGYIIREKIKFIMNDLDVNVRDNFYIIYPNIDKWLLFGLLNNFYTYSRLENIGKHYGGGVLKLQKYDLDNVMILNIGIISENDIKKIKELSKKLIEQNDEKIVYEITNVISKYESVSELDIYNIYMKQRNNRLSKGEANES